MYSVIDGGKFLAPQNVPLGQVQHAVGLMIQKASETDQKSFGNKRWKRNNNSDDEKHVGRMIRRTPRACSEAWRRKRHDGVGRHPVHGITHHQKNTWMDWCTGKYGVGEEFGLISWNRWPIWHHQASFFFQRNKPRTGEDLKENIRHETAAVRPLTRLLKLSVCPAENGGHFRHHVERSRFLAANHPVRCSEHTYRTCIK